MCGRYSLSEPLEVIKKRFNAKTLDELAWKPRYNIAPSQEVPVIVQHSQDEERELQLFRWGLVPFWSKSLKTGYNMANLRADNILSKTAWQKLLARKRCLVPSTHFFEWTTVHGQKYPVVIQPQESGIFAFGALYDVWKSPNGQELHTFSLITTEPNHLIGTLHDRMPVIIEEAREKEWLDPRLSDLKVIKDFLNPAPEEFLRFHPVSRLVNSPRHDTPEILEEVTYPSENQLF